MFRKLPSLAPNCDKARQCKRPQWKPDPGAAKEPRTDGSTKDWRGYDYGHRFVFDIYIIRSPFLKYDDCHSKANDAMLRKSQILEFWFKFQLACPRGSRTYVSINTIQVSKSVFGWTYSTRSQSRRSRPRRKIRWKILHHSTRPWRLGYYLNNTHLIRLKYISESW